MNVVHSPTMNPHRLLGTKQEHPNFVVWALPLAIARQSHGQSKSLVS
jgi:hypothetical protein